MAARPCRNSARLRHSESSVYASDTRCGSRLFQASSAIRTLATALAHVNGGLMGAIAAGAPGVPSVMSSPPSDVR